ncbi:hypothetical protein DB30_02441 [Enhygromyxa salina]|uniref:Uncharacterized protein n=1 Tax=Enhygromyxa salina TaxID=215803 RepID=A0A0C1Z2T4_9BACT|nr:hypothetical protein DB30_02441 [Enhygromyxa salina]
MLLDQLVEQRLLRLSALVAVAALRRACRGNGAHDELLGRRGAAFSAHA